MLGLFVLKFHCAVVLTAKDDCVHSKQFTDILASETLLS